MVLALILSDGDEWLLTPVVGVEAADEEVRLEADRQSERPGMNAEQILQALASTTESAAALPVVVAGDWIRVKDDWWGRRDMPVEAVAANPDEGVLVIAPSWDELNRFIARHAPA